MNSDFTFKTALELSRPIAARQLSPVELMQATLAQAERINPGLNCFATYAPEPDIPTYVADSRRVTNGANRGSTQDELNRADTNCSADQAIERKRQAPMTPGDRQSATATISASAAPIPAGMP